MHHGLLAKVIDGGLREEAASPVESTSKKAGLGLRWFDGWVKRLAAVVGLLAATYGLIYNLMNHGKGEAKTPGNLTLITDVTLIENQYQQATGQPLTDTATKELVRGAMNLAKAGQYDESRKLFQQLATIVPVPSVLNNLGALDAEAKDEKGARQAYEQAIAKDPENKIPFRT